MRFSAKYPGANGLREFDKKSLKHCPSGDHLISFHNLSPRLANELLFGENLCWSLEDLTG